MPNVRKSSILIVTAMSVRSAGRLDGCRLLVVDAGKRRARWELHKTTGVGIWDTT